ncbi:hypothetical protein GCM10010274_24850 [Streptomyces lavendofoliae]|uniref:Uncharacterized protein n=1 Tax=Streptomyces lavendofoliae TaxID=67314 RepID=A0A918M4A1_9ACTN|nr:hypothetical protein GCM10010274_24850 [Streptomyces lavendofoliae]
MRTTAYRLRLGPWGFAVGLTAGAPASRKPPSWAGPVPGRVGTPADGRLIGWNGGGPVPTIDPMGAYYFFL